MKFDWTHYVISENGKPLHAERYYADARRWVEKYDPDGDYSSEAHVSGNKYIIKQDWVINKESC